MPYTPSKNQELAELFCQSDEYASNLLYIEEFERFCLYQKDGGFFKPFAEKDIEREVYYFLKKNTSKNLTLAIVRDVLSQIKFECYKRYPTYDSPYIAFSDQLFDTETQAFEPHTTEKCAFISIPISAQTFLESKPNFIPPRFQKFLEFILVHEDMTPDPELMALVQEMFGYCLLPQTSAEATFFCIGDGANGKSKLLEVLKILVGQEFCAAQSIENLTNNQFATSTLIGKRLNVCTEEESAFVKQDKFKALISGELMQVEKKFQDSMLVRLPVKFVFATNEMPSFSGFNHAFLRRIKIIPFMRTIKPHERDTRILDKLILELPQIYLWALHGMMRLLSRDYQFSNSAAMDAKARELERAMASAIMFLRESYEEKEGGFVANNEMYANYKDVWCPMNGKKPVSKEKFFREVNRDLTLPAKFKRHYETGYVERGRQVVPLLQERDIDPRLIIEDLPTF